MTVRSLIQGFWNHLSIRRKWQSALLLGLVILASFAEVLSLGAVVPFLGVFVQPEKIYEISSLKPIFVVMGVGEAKDLLFPVTVGFILLALLSGAMRLLLLYVQTKLSFGIGSDVSCEVFRRMLYQPYSVHISKNSSDIISGIVTKTAVLTNYFFTPLFLLFGNIFIFLAIITGLLIIEPLIMLSAVIGFGVIYSATAFLTRKKIQGYSRKSALESNKKVKVLQEGLGGIRDVLLHGTQEVFYKEFERSDSVLKNTSAGQVFISSSPRFFVEALGIALIAVLAYTLAQKVNDFSSTITILGALAFGAQRLLPVIQQIYQSYITMNGAKDSVADILHLLNQPIDEANIKQTASSGTKIVSSSFFRDELRLENVSFKYNQEAPDVLGNISLTIKKGSRIGVKGITGCGKSTLLDIIMGLLPPTSGSILVDGKLLEKNNLRLWQQCISHVPQSIFLSDSSIAENIAFGVDKKDIDPDLLIEVSKQAQLFKTIQKLPNKFETLVGERGIRLSGGQRQRIGIARALYRQASVIIFDEATSALDNETEQAVMDAINNLGKDLTLIIVAHRLSTLEACGEIYELNGGDLFCNKSKVLQSNLNVSVVDRMVAE